MRRAKKEDRKNYYMEVVLEILRGLPHLNGRRYDIYQLADERWDLSNDKVDKGIEDALEMGYISVWGGDVYTLTEEGLDYIDRFTSSNNLSVFFIEKEKHIMRKAKEEKKQEGNRVTVENDVRIPGTNYILEKGEEIIVYPKVKEKNLGEVNTDAIDTSIGYMYPEDISQWAQSRNTDIEVAIEILKYDDPQRVWEDPTDQEFNEIMRRAFSKTDEDVLKWGFENVRRSKITRESNSKKLRVKEEEQPLDKVMKKVSNGKDLSKEDKDVLKAALDAAKGKDDEEDIVDKIMKKVSDGKDLTDKEKKLLSAAQDAEKGEKD